MATITDSIDEASGLVGTPTIGVAFLLAMVLCAVAWPLATYTLSLAAFGLAHVLSELRFVHRSYGNRIHTQLAGVLLALLAGVVGLRVATMTDVLSPAIAGQAEVGIALALGIVVLPLLARSVYGVAAAVHAWVETPILMVALLGVWPVTDAEGG